MRPPYGAVPATGTDRRTVPRACPPPALAPADSFAAVLFDLDGVLTPTADIHTRAWTTMFDEFLVPRGSPRSPTTTTCATSTASRASTASARSSPRATSRCPTATRPIRRARTPSPASATARTTCSSRSCGDDGIAPYPGSLRFLDHLADDRHEGRRRVVVAQRPRGPRRLRPGTALRGRHRRHGRGRRAHRRQAGARHVPERRRAPRRRRRPTPSWSRTPSPASPPAGPATSASSSASIAAPGAAPCASTAPTSSSTTSPSCWTAVKRQRPGAPRPRPLPARPVAPRRDASTTPATSA